ncbi:hypothetical protein [Vogesella mureinivorans]|uniref:hypothetical protein n=1 Tax=Vogesella mureinivorans TaxID=657276 RepID=UPI0011CBF668|nr:hypothetical protein [Vogesella mureinivorans]
MAYSISTLGVPVSIITPLTNANALVALAVSALVFREWSALDDPRVLAGALFIVLGAVVVATAKNWLNRPHFSRYLISLTGLNHHLCKVMVRLV